MLTGQSLNALIMQGIAAICDVLLRTNGLDGSLPRTNEDVIWY